MVQRVQREANKHIGIYIKGNTRSFHCVKKICFRLYNAVLNIFQLHLVAVCIKISFLH